MITQNSPSVNRAPLKAMAAPGRRCFQCGKDVGQAYMVDNGVHTCKACYDKGSEERIASEVSKRASSEANSIYKLVCPACKARIRRKG